MDTEKVIFPLKSYLFGPEKLTFLDLARYP
jgi:hypothetical protein